MTRVKISGVTDAEDARMAASAGADLIACVFYARSPRYVIQATAWSIRRALPSHVGFVGIFVDTPLPLVQHMVDHCGLDHAQLFGGEPRGDVDAIRPHAFKAVTVEHPDAIDRTVRAFAGHRHGRPDAPGLLLNLTRNARERWSSVVGAAAKTPLLLASPALSAATVGAAIRTARPWGVDIWEGVESTPGRLDPGRVEAFIAAVRAADRAG